jgi:hypothetical protein
MSAGGRPSDGRLHSRRVYSAPARPICFVRGFGGGNASVNAELRVPIVDPRLRVKCSIVFRPDPPFAGSPPSFTFGRGNTLWLCTRERDRSGNGLMMPVTNLEGSFAATGVPALPGPTVIPLDADAVLASALFGYSWETVSSADEIYGKAVFAVADANSYTRNAGAVLVTGWWHLQARWGLTSGAEISDYDWNDMEALMNPEVPSGTVTLDRGAF